MQSIHPLMLAFLAGLFTWAMTAFGSATILIRKNLSQRLMDMALGFSAGVMLAASYWSLLAPAVEIARETSAVPWLAPSLGFRCRRHRALGLGQGHAARASDAVRPVGGARGRPNVMGPQHAADARRHAAPHPRGHRARRGRRRRGVGSAGHLGGRRPGAGAGPRSPELPRGPRGQCAASPRRQTRAVAPPTSAR